MKRTSRNGTARYATHECQLLPNLVSKAIYGLILTK